MNAALRVVACSAAVLIGCNAWGAETGAERFRLTGALGAGYDSNLLASQSNAEREGSAFYSGLLAGDVTWIPGNVVSLILRGQLQGDAYDRFDDLSNGKALLMARANYKPGIGFFAPLLTAWASAARLEYGSEIRSGEEYRGGALITQQLTTKLGLRGELKGFHRRAEGQVFDLAGQSAVIGMVWLPDAGLLLNLAYEYQTGDNTSSGAPTLRNTLAADAIEPDDAFGGLARNQFAYRFDAETQTLTAGFNYRLTQKLALDGQLQTVGVNADLGNRYRRNFALLGLVMRF